MAHIAYFAMPGTAGVAANVLSTIEVARSAPSTAFISAINFFAALHALPRMRQKRAGRGQCFVAKL